MDTITITILTALAFICGGIIAANIYQRWADQDKAAAVRVFTERIDRLEAGYVPPCDLMTFYLIVKCEAVEWLDNPEPHYYTLSGACSLGHPETWLEPLNQEFNPEPALSGGFWVGGEPTLSFNPDFLKLMKQARDQQEENKMTFRGSIKSDCRKYSLTC